MQKNTVGNRFYYKEIQTTKGQRGSPIYSDFGWSVIGVHTEGTFETNCGTINIPFHGNENKF